MSDDGSSRPSEQARLEASALVASRVSRQESRFAIRRASLFALMREAIIVLLVIIVALLAWHAWGESKRTRDAAIKTAQQNCQLYHDVAVLPLPATSSTLGIHLVADFRNSYYDYDCQSRLGNLPSPDHRLLQYLVPAASG